MKAILFDSDGLLVDTEQMFFEATRAAFEMAGASISSDQWARWYLAEGQRSRDIAALVGVPASSIEATIEKRDELFWNRVDQGVPLLPGVRETVTGLAEQFSLAIVTGASRQHFDRVHAATGITHLFAVVVTSDDYQCAKPHPQGYVTAMQELSLGPSDCLAVEDSPRGATAAVAAGIRCCVIPTSLTKVALCPPACTFLSDVSELIQFTRTEAGTRI